MRFKNVVYAMMDDVIKLLFLVYHSLVVEAVLGVEIIAV